MRSIKSIALGGVALIATLLPAVAQVNVVPQSGLTTAYLARTTYSATFFGLVPVATATDLFCITGSASKLIRLQNVKLSGSGTAISLPVTVLRRASADTGGTAATTTANPANTISLRDTTQVVSTATLISYTVNPTIVDTSPTYIDSAQFSLAAAASGPTNSPLFFDWSRDVENLLQVPTLRGAAQQICVNLNSTTITSGLLTGSLTWTEE